MVRTTKELKAKELKEGQKAPDFSLPSDDGSTVKLSGLKGKTVVLYFYPKDLTSGCTQEACDFKSAHSKLLKKGAVVLGVSKDSLTLHQKFKTTHKLPFPLLSDSEGKVCERYGVWKQKSMYGRKYMGIERMTFVIAPDGKIQKIFPKVKVKGHVEAVLSIL